MEYISHEDYKKMMENFSKGTPKKMLREDFERPDAREMEEENELGRITDAVERVFANDSLTTANEVDALAEEIRNAWSKSRGYGEGDEIDFVAEYLTDWADNVRHDQFSQWEKPSVGEEENTIWGEEWKNWINTAVYDISEGNAFTAGLAKAKKGEEFKVGNKTFKDRTNYDAPIKEDYRDKVDNLTILQRCIELGDKNPKKFGELKAEAIEIYEDYKEHKNKSTLDSEVESLLDSHQPPSSVIPYETPDEDSRGMFRGMREYQSDAPVKKESWRSDPTDEDGEEYSIGIEKELEDLAKAGKIDQQTLNNALDYVSDHDYELFAHKLDANYVIKQVTGREDASVSEEYDSPYDGGADDLAAMASDNDREVAFAEKAIEKILGEPVKFVGQDKNDLATYVGSDPRVKYSIDDFGFIYKDNGFGRKKISNQPIGENIPAVGKKLGSVDEYQFDQMYPDDPGPFEGKNVDKMIKEFLLKEDDVNWDRMDDEEAEENETDNGIEEDFNPDSSDFEQAITKELQYLGDEELTDVEYEQALKALENPKIVDKLWGVHPKKAATALAKMVRSREVGEGLNPAPFQATGPTIQTVEGKKNKFAHLTSEERDQLRQYVETIRTVKEQIKKMTEKSGMKEGGDMTNLVMKPTTMSEDGEVDTHEEIESKIDPKLHDTFHKVLDMVTKQLLNSGFEESQVEEFLKHEVSELPSFITRQYESK